MSDFGIGIIGLILLFVLIFMRMPIAFALTVDGIIGLWFFQGAGAALNVLGRVPFATMNTYVWTVIPLFVFMGYVALYSGLAEEFYEGIRKWVGHYRGGLAAAVILGNTGFGACTGDMISAAVTFTAISLPEMRKYKYADSLTLGSVVAGSVLAILIPPSLIFIMYGALTGTSIGKLFLAGVIPGIILAVLYLIVIQILCQIDPQMGPRGPKTNLKDKIFASTGMWTLILVFGFIIGGIFLGLFTPTEAGGGGAFLVLIIGLIRKKLSWKGFQSSLFQSGMTISMVAFLLIGCMIFNKFLVIAGVPNIIAWLISGITQSPSLTLLIIAVAILIMGCFLDAMSILLIMTPILHPVVTGLGIDSIHFGVLMAIVIATGALTPPFGVVVYAVKGAAADVPLFTIFRSIYPFTAVILLIVILVIFFPQISLYLPGMIAN